MNKYLLRSVALFLTPSLVLDPVAVSAFQIAHTSLPIVQSSPSSASYNEQALTLALSQARRAFSSAGWRVDRYATAEWSSRVAHSVPLIYQQASEVSKVYTTFEQGNLLGAIL